MSNSNSKSLRLTVSKHHEVYLNSIASQMGCNSSEAINYLLWELRRNNYQFGSQLPQYLQPQAQVQPQVQHNFDPNTYEQATVMSGLSFIPQSPQAIKAFEATQEIHQEIDPIIEKFISLGLVDQF